MTHTDKGKVCPPIHAVKLNIRILICHILAILNYIIGCIKIILGRIKNISEFRIMFLKVFR